MRWPTDSDELGNSLSRDDQLASVSSCPHVLHAVNVHKKVYTTQQTDDKKNDGPFQECLVFGSETVDNTNQGRKGYSHRNCKKAQKDDGNQQDCSDKP